MFYKKLSLYLSENQNISKDDKELYEYAAKVVVHGIINITVTVLIGIFFGMLKECICLFITFFILRKFTGGLHASKYIYCLISSIVLMILSLFIIKYLEQNSYHILFLSVLIVATLLIWFFAPIDNKSKKLSIKEKKVYKYFSVILSLIFLLIVLVLMYKNFIIAYPFGIGVIITSLLLTLAFFKDKLSKIGE